MLVQQQVTPENTLNVSFSEGTSFRDQQLLQDKIATVKELKKILENNEDFKKSLNQKFIDNVDMFLKVAGGYSVLTSPSSRLSLLNFTNDRNDRDTYLKEHQTELNNLALLQK